MAGSWITNRGISGAEGKQIVYNFPVSASNLTIDSLRFDPADWKYHGEREPGKSRLWETASHDAVSLHFFAKPPDLPSVGAVDQLRQFYGSQLAPGAGKIVELATPSIAGCRAIRLLFKVPQKPTGMIYQGSFTIPFRDFSFVIKVQSRETGPTGVREAILTQMRLAKGEVPNTKGGPLFANWNPDAAEYDQKFPSHPLSRLRAALTQIAETAATDRAMRQSAPFPLPTK
jgi:hypothetical protein